VSRYTNRSATYIGSLTFTAKIAERLAAFVQIAVIASIFGATTHSDLYFIASIIPLTAGTIVGEALATSVLPTLVQREATVSLEAYLGATFWAALATLTAVLTAYVAIVWIVVPRAAPAGSSSVTAWLAFSPTILTLGLATYFSALLLQQERYTWPPFRSAVATVAGLAFLGIALLFTDSITWIALATSGGYLVSSLLLFREIGRTRGFGFVRAATRNALKQVLDLRANVTTSIAGGILGGQSFVLLERAFAASLGVGAVSTISYARGIVFTPNIVGQAIAMGLYPGMLRAHEAHDRRFVRASFLGGLRVTLLISLASVAYIALFATPIVQTLLQRGALDAKDAVAVAHALVAFSPAVIGSMLLIVTSRAFYASNLFSGIVWSQLAVLLAYGPLALVLRGAYGATGLAAAFGVAELAGGLLSVVLVARLVDITWPDCRPLLAIFLPVALVTVVLGGIRLAVDQAPLGEETAAVWETIAGGLALVLVVSAFLLLSGWPEAAVFRRRLIGLRSAGRRAGAPS
jgi:putative peptidoglycan lipid II flippase